MRYIFSNFQLIHLIVKMYKEMPRLITLGIIISLLTQFVLTKETKECVYVKKIQPSIVVDPPNLSSCQENVCPPDICVQEYTMYYSGIEPYHEPFQKILNETISHCCWNLNYFTPELKYILTSNITTVIEENMKEENSDIASFIFPILGHRYSKRLDGHFFIPLIEPPGAFYVTPKHKIDVKKLIWNCLELWPLLMICVIMAAIAGFIAWLFETRSNKEEFPRPFMRGWYKMLVLHPFKRIPALIFHNMFQKRYLLPTGSRKMKKNASAVTIDLKNWGSEKVPRFCSTIGQICN